MVGFGEVWGCFTYLHIYDYSSNIEGAFNHGHRYRQRLALCFIRYRLRQDLLCRLICTHDLIGYQRLIDQYYSRCAYPDRYALAAQKNQQINGYLVLCMTVLAIRDYPDSLRVQL